MNSKLNTLWNKKLIVDIICYAYFILFLYTALSKLATYNESELQLSKSPIISEYAATIAWALPSIEIIIAIALLIPRTKLAAIYASLVLMVMFTTYILTILHSGGHVPCSCGGVIASLDWNQHLYFNLGFIALAISAIFLQPKNHNKKQKLALNTGAQDI